MPTQADIARDAGLPPELGERLKGETTEALKADARQLAETIGVESVPAHVALARRVIALTHNKPERHRGLVESLHPSSGEED